MEAKLRVVIEEVLAELGISADFVVEHPADLAHGDYATNVALVCAKSLGEAPPLVAKRLTAALTDRLSEVDRIEIAGPGFINFHLKGEYFAHLLQEALVHLDAWGKNSTWAGREVLVEYTSPNLFKPLHVGNLVGNIIGESLTRLFEFSGATVRRLNYPSDIGLTVAKAVWGLTKTKGDPDDIVALGGAYRFGNEAYESDAEAKQEIIVVNQALYAGSDENLLALRARGIATSKRQLDAICERLGTHFDAVIYESEASARGIELVKENLGRVFTESEGAVVYEGERVGLHTRVFLNSKGLPTYEAKDIGNFAKKQELYPEWHTSIVVTGNEQTEYFKVIFAAIGEVFPEAKERQLEHIPTGFLTLSTGKMSSRKGNVLTGESLLSEIEEAARERAASTRTDDLGGLTKQVAVAALKYQILRQATGTNIVFDKERALSFEGDSGPYLQYTYARIKSLLEKAQEVGVLPNADQPPATAYRLERHLYQFGEVITAALKERAPHHVSQFLTALAAEFNALYATEKIADGNDSSAPYKAALAVLTAETLKSGLHVLGIEAPERM